MQYKLHGTGQRSLEVLGLVHCPAEIEVTLSFHITPANLDFTQTKNSMLLIYELRLKLAIDSQLNLADLQDDYNSSCTRHTSHPMTNQLVQADVCRFAAGDRLLQLRRAGPWE